MTNGTNIKTTDYLDASASLSTGPFGYNKNLLEFFPHAEGYVKATNFSLGGNPNYAFNYVYNYTDHLGNVRLSYAKDPQTGNLKILDESHYYPFGLKHQEYSTFGFVSNPIQGVIIAPVTNNPYKYKYNGKEFQDELELGLYDYGARNYDPAIGRWNSYDPLAEQDRRWSPYRYAYDNPLIFIDPDGMLEDDYQLHQDGSIELIQRTDATTDTLYASDSNGNVDQNNSITVNKGVLDNTETMQIPDQISDPENIIPTRIMDATTAKNSQELFEFMADNTSVEHSIATFENGKIFIGTSFREHAELSLNHTMNSGNGNLISHDHSHLSGTGPSGPDSDMAGLIQGNQPGTNPIFRIYNPSTGGYTTYDQNSGGTELDMIIITPTKK